ncbi:DUF2487 family protein [Paenibacillus gallinarum]|uniref:DUF2487 family protein n=1 Tax=Paenibacillus gallinarum TaxID=2762232 RepID=A0ABR8SX29_9BACL|nr:DUF2487 family protein [Paenibacillus gallinarum]MBD7968063.1 DUF2487 family protein [Paenibacillus gallinarum]
MKFSEITSEDWVDLQPYLDTCLLPYTALTGQESPYETVSVLERLRDFLDYVEIPFKGRIVTYPAVHYSQASQLQQLNELCSHLKAGGFKYVIVMTADEALVQAELPEADLVLSLSALSSRKDKDELSHVNVNEFKKDIQSQIYQMWI